MFRMLRGQKDILTNLAIGRITLCVRKARILLISSHYCLLDDVHIQTEVQSCHLFATSCELPSLALMRVTITQCFSWCPRVQFL